MTEKVRRRVRVIVWQKNRAKKFKNESSPEFFSCPFFSEKNFGVTGAKILRIVSLLKILSWKLSFSKKSGRLTRVFTLLMSHNNSHASSNFFSHWRCLLYFICLKKNCIFAKDLILKAKFLKKNLTDWHEASHCWCHTITRMRLRTFSVIGDVYFTLLALKRIVSLLKILSWKPSFSKKIWLIDTRLHTVVVTQ